MESLSLSKWSNGVSAVNNPSFFKKQSGYPFLVLSDNVYLKRFSLLRKKFLDVSGEVVNTIVRNLKGLF